jgi:hypothetical protein
MQILKNINEICTVNSDFKLLLLLLTFLLTKFFQKWLKIYF